MGLLDLWDYLRSTGDPRLRKQGYAGAGMGLLTRYRRAQGFWEPHLENNRRNLLALGERLGPERGGTLLVLGAGRLLDVPWQQLFPRFTRVVLYDADFTIKPYIARLLAAPEAAGIPQPIFEIGDLTESVAALAAWAEHTIRNAASAASAATALAEGSQQAGAPQPAWARSFADVRLVVSTNLLSQLGHFPRLHIETEFKRRFKSPFAAQTRAAESLECYFDRVRARHVLDLAQCRKAFAYLSTDIGVVNYELTGPEAGKLLAGPVPPNAGVELCGTGFQPVNHGQDARATELKFHWPVKILEQTDPLHGQRVKDLWPRGASVEGPRRWAWHIIPQGCEKRYRACGRVHLVEAWSKGLGTGD